MASVYHYCTMKTLNLILKGKELKFSDVRNSNDNEEIIKGLEAYIQYMYENIDEYKDLIIFYETFLLCLLKMLLFCNFT